MKLYFNLFLSLSLVLLPVHVYPQFKPVEKSELTLTNLLTNGGAERGKSGWTITTDTFSVTTTAANVGTGTAAFSWNSAGAARDFSSAAISTPYGLERHNGAASCNIQTPSGTATHLIQAYDSTNSAVLASTTIVSSATYARSTVNFPWPAAGTNVKLRLLSVASDEPQIYIDDCWLGDAQYFNMVTVGMATDWVAWTPTGTWTTNTTYTGYYRRVGDSLEIDVAIALSGAPTSATLYINLPSGFSIDTSKASGTATTKGVVAFSSAGTGYLGYMRLAAFTDITQVQPLQSGGQAITQNGPGTFANGDWFRIQLTGLPIVGWTSTGTAINTSQLVFPTIQKFTSGSAQTYTLPTSPRPTYLKVRMVGGGGGGAGSGTAGGTAAGDGGASYWKSADGNTTYLTANGGKKGVFGSAGGDGGSASIANGPIGTALSGSKGGAGTSLTQVSTVALAGAPGGASFFAGSGAGGEIAGNGLAAQTNTGSGGGGGGTYLAANSYSGAGGGAGGYVEALITSPASSYQYTVGAFGAKGAAGTGGYTGGDGADGYIEVTEYYGNNAPVLVPSTSTSQEVSNVGISATIASNILTVALKQKDGSSNCSAGNPCIIGMGDETSDTTGKYQNVSVTGAMSVALGTGDSIGATTAVSTLFNVWFFKDTTNELALEYAGEVTGVASGTYTPLTDNARNSSSALTGGSDTDGKVAWSTTAHSTKWARRIGQIRATWTTGTGWTAVGEVSLYPTKVPRTFKYIDSTATTTFVAPKNVSSVVVIGHGGGGGGGGGATSAAYGGMGGGGAASVSTAVAVSPGTSYTVTAGAGGTAGAAGSGQGGYGSDSSFGSLVTFKGGAAGYGGYSFTNAASVVLTNGFGVGGGGRSGMYDATSGATGGTKSAYAAGGNSGGGTEACGTGGGGGDGAGGNGGAAGQNNGTAGLDGGGGGGGGGNSGGTGGAGGAGGPGKIVVQWLQ